MRTGTHYFPKNVASIERCSQINYLNKIDESHGENNKNAKSPIEKKHVNCTNDKQLVNTLQCSSPKGSSGGGIGKYGATNTKVISLGSPKLECKITK